MLRSAVLILYEISSGNLSALVSFHLISPTAAMVLLMKVSYLLETGVVCVKVAMWTTLFSSTCFCDGGSQHVNMPYEGLLVYCAAFLSTELNLTSDLYKARQYLFACVALTVVAAFTLLQPNSAEFSSPV